MFRKIMIAAFVIAALAVSIAPAVMKITDMRRETAAAASRTTAALPGKADKDAPEGGRVGREAEEGTGRNILRAAVVLQDCQPDGNTDAAFRTQARDLAIDCGKALRGANLLNSDILDMLGGMVQKALCGQ